MRVLILGGAGMLGHKLWQIFSSKTDTYTTLRQSASAYAAWNLFDPARVYEHVSAQDDSELLRVIAQVRPQVIINCIGIVKQHPVANDRLTSITVNASFPHRLAQICALANIRLIHISTDCVFSGRKGMYLETDVSDAEDIYGRTKYLGEVDQEGCLTLRTSMIGFELESTHGLLEWFLGQETKDVRGFTKAIFSGFTTATLATILWDIITYHPTLSGLFHVAAQPIDKYSLLSLIKDVFGLNIGIIPDSAVNIDRSLNGSKFASATGFVAPSWNQMIEQLATESSFYKRVKSTNANR